MIPTKFGAGENPAPLSEGLIGRINNQCEDIPSISVIASHSTILITLNGRFPTVRAGLGRFTPANTVNGGR
jgi:hypothetical protein